MIHRHVWKVLEREKLPTFLERTLAAGMTSLKSYYPERDRPVILVHARCDRCGTEKVYRA